MLTPFGQNLYIANGPTVSFHGFPYPTRMAVVRLASGQAWVWSPIELTEALADAVQAVGPVAYIVSPNKLHFLALPAWRRRWPDAKLFAPPGLARKMRTLHFDAELGDVADPHWLNEIDQVVFRGSIAMQEVVFFHRASRTAIFGDLIQRFAESQALGWKGAVLRLGGLVGAHGSTPREWRLSFLSREAARAARQTVLEWNPRQLLIAHGDCVSSGAAPVIAQALRWI
jgi:hypothetical protein